MPTIHTRTPDEIIESHNRRRLSLEECSVLPDCKRICAEYHNRFGGCYRLDAPRLAAILGHLLNRNLKARISADHLVAGIEAYHAECQATAADRRRNNIPARDLVSFLTKCGKLETYIEKGLEARNQASVLKAGTDGQKHADLEKARIRTLLIRTALPFGELVRRAVIACPGAGSNWDDPVIRAKMLEILS